MVPGRRRQVRLSHLARQLIPFHRQYHLSVRTLPTNIRASFMGPYLAYGYQVSGSAGV
jgi:hypothetical protein